MQHQLFGGEAINTGVHQIFIQDHEGQIMQNENLNQINLNSSYSGRILRQEKHILNNSHHVEYNPANSLPPTKPVNKNFKRNLRVSEEINQTPSAHSHMTRFQG